MTYRERESWKSGSSGQSLSTAASSLLPNFVNRFIVVARRRRHRDGRRSTVDGDGDFDGSRDSLAHTHAHGHSRHQGTGRSTVYHFNRVRARRTSSRVSDFHTQTHTHIAPAIRARTFYQLILLPRNPDIPWQYRFHYRRRRRTSNLRILPFLPSHRIVFALFTPERERKDCVTVTRGKIQSWNYLATLCSRVKCIDTCAHAELITYWTKCRVITLRALLSTARVDILLFEWTQSRGQKSLGRRRWVPTLFPRRNWTRISGS